jgi:hypothetical protein
MNPPNGPGAYEDAGRTQRRASTDDDEGSRTRGTDYPPTGASDTVPPQPGGAVKIEADATISFPRDLCFSTYRDRLAELVPYLPNVRGIEVKETETQADGKVSKLNVWHAKADIPGPAQAFLKPDMLKWDDHATWDGTAFTCDWRVATHFFKDRVKCQGRNTFLVVDGADPSPPPTACAR